MERIVARFKSLFHSFGLPPDRFSVLPPKLSLNMTVQEPGKEAQITGHRRPLQIVYPLHILLKASHTQDKYIFKIMGVLIGDAIPSLGGCHRLAQSHGGFRIDVILRTVSQSSRPRPPDRLKYQPRITLIKRFEDRCQTLP